MGTNPADGPPRLENLRERTHPQDWPNWKAALDAHVRGDSDIFDAESRLRQQTSPSGSAAPARM